MSFGTAKKSSFPPYSSATRDASLSPRRKSVEPDHPPMVRARSVSRLLAGTAPLERSDSKPQLEKVKSLKKSSSSSSLTPPTLKNKQTLQRFYAAWNSSSSESILSCIDQNNYQDHSDKTKYSQLQNKIKQITNGSLKWEILHMVAEGDQVAVVCTLKGSSTPMWSELFRLTENRITERWGSSYSQLISQSESKHESLAGDVTEHIDNLNVEDEIDEE